MGLGGRGSGRGFEFGPRDGAKAARPLFPMGYAWCGEQQTAKVMAGILRSTVKPPLSPEFLHLFVLERHQVLVLGDNEVAVGPLGLPPRSSRQQMSNPTWPARRMSRLIDLKPVDIVKLGGGGPGPARASYFSHCDPDYRPEGG